MTTQTEARVSAWKIDPAHTLVELAARHMMITTVKGRFSGVAGTLTTDAGEPARSRVAVEIEASSISTGVEQRDQHLKSADFLEVERFPVITFESTRVEGGYAREGDRFRVVGDLTIRGRTREVSLEVTYEGEAKDPWGGERSAFEADAVIDRRDFGLTWNQALETGGILVGNQVKIHLEVQAVRQ